MTLFDIEYRKFEHKPQIHQLNDKFSFKMEELFETLETVGFEMTKTRSSNMIESIVNRNSAKAFNRHNDPNQCLNVHKHTCQ